MISSASSGSKCLKNLDIVVESADEGQALLLLADDNAAPPPLNCQNNRQQHSNLTRQNQQPNATESGKNGTAVAEKREEDDGGGASSFLFCHESENEQHHQQQQQQQRQAHQQQGDDAHAPTTTFKMKATNAIISDDDEDKVTTHKVRKKATHQQPSRVERSRLSVITFLNNITAPPTRADGKSWRSLSMSASSVHHQQQQQQHAPAATVEQNVNTNNSNQMQSEKQHNKLGTSTTTDNGTEREGGGTNGGGGGHRLTKSLCGKAADELHHVLIMGGGGGVAGTESGGGGSSGASSTEKGNSIGTGGGASSGGGNVMLADRLSIKSGASSTSSSGCHSESQCNLSVGKQMKARECPVCYIRQHPGNFHKLQTCSHLTCKTCLIKYLNLEIMESRTNISCPNCTVLLHASDIYALLEYQPDLLDRFEMFALRRALSTDPDARWCPAPDCTYAVIAYSCAACPQLKCERCATMFCYHCKNNWHPNQTCDQARAKLSGGLRGFAAQAAAIVTDSTSTGGSDVTKACPRCGVQIMKMNDGSCNHMQCVLCNAEFCWLCLKQINELHYLSPTGCTFWGKKPWTRKKKLLWQVGTLIGAPLGIALIAGLAVPGIICGVPIFVGRKIYQRFANLSKMRRRLVTVLGVFGSLIVSPVLAVLTVGVGVPIMLAYVYGVVPLSLCRNGGCGGGSSAANSDDELLNAMVSDFDVAYGEESVAVSPTAADNESASQNGGGGQRRLHATRNHSNDGGGQPAREEEKTSTKSSFHHRRQSIASSGLVSLTDKVNTEDASIQAIAGSQYNFDNRSVHTVWSSGQYGVQLGAVELAQEASSYNNEDAENSSTLACCSASIVAQASERRSLTGSNGSIRNVRPRSSISNSRGNSEDKGKFLRKPSRNCKDHQHGNGGAMEGESVVLQQQRYHVRRSSSQSVTKHATPAVVVSSSSIGTRNAVGNSSASANTTRRPRLTLRAFLRHPVNSIFGAKSAGVKN